jgi:hypothetical protein
MKRTQSKLEKYSAKIEKALHRSARRAELIAAATGTKLVIYEKGRVKHVNPRIKPEAYKMIRDIQSELVRRDQGYPFVQGVKSQRIKEISTPPRTGARDKSAAEKRARYGPR